MPDIRWHELRATYCTILLKNDFNPQAVLKLMGLEPFIDEMLPEEEVIELCDVDCMDLVASELIE